MAAERRAAGLPLRYRLAACGIQPDRDIEITTVAPPLSSSRSIWFGDRFGLSPVVAGYCTAACVFTGSLVRPFGGAMADRFGGIKTLTVVYILAATILAVISIGPPTLPVALVLPSGGRTGLLPRPLVDPVSGQPGFKSTPARIAKLAVEWRGFLIARDVPEAIPALYFTKVRVAKGWLVELAGQWRPRRTADCGA